MLAALSRLFRLRRRRWRHGRPDARRALLWLLAMVALHVLAMAVFEDMSPGEALWLTAATLSTVGYGDLAAKTPEGRLATALLLMLGGVFVLAKLAGDWFEWLEEVRERKRRGTWRWGMEQHLVVAGTPEGDAARFHLGLVRELRRLAAWREVPVLLLTRAYDLRPEGLPQALCDLGVVHVSGAATEPDSLRAADAAMARAVVVLADRTDDPVFDSVAMDVATRARDLAAARGTRPMLVVECVDDRNRPRLLAAGCDAAVRPLRAFPEMIARALAAPGAERLLEELFTAEGEELHRVALPAPWRGRWIDAAGRLLAEGLGTAIAYQQPDGRVVLNPPGPAVVEAVALYVILHDSREAMLARLPALLGGGSAA